MNECKVLKYMLVCACMSVFATYGDDMERFINNIGTTWRAEQPRVWSQDQFQSLVSKRDLSTNNSSLRYIHHDSVHLRTSIPEFFDARKKWPLCTVINDVRHQGDCDACWALTAVSVMTDRLCIFNCGEINVPLSSTDVLSCCKTCGNGCDGGYPHEAFNFWVTDGIVSGGLYGSHEGCKPFNIAPSFRLKYGNAPTPPCVKQCRPGYTRSYYEDKYYGGHIYKIEPNVDQMRLDILERGPIASLMDVYSDMSYYKEGVYQHVSGNFIGYHAVKLLGWGVENNVKYWLASSTWGTKWGLNGYFKILRGSNHCRIESDAFSGIPRKTC